MKPSHLVRSGLLFLAGFSLSSPVEAQFDRFRIFSQPSPPPREVLDRLNLRMSFRVFVPMDSSQDGLTTVQLKGTDLFVQTRSGLVTLIDAETGAARWRQRVGRSYVAEHALAFNSREVYVVNNTHLYALDRTTGAENWSTQLAEGVSSAPVADENMIFIPTQTGKLAAFFLPRPELAAAAAKGETLEQRKQRVVGVGRGTSSSSTTVSYLTRSARQAHTEDDGGPRLLKAWTEYANLRLELPLILAYDRIILPTPNGVVAGVAKLAGPGGGASEAFRFRAEAPIVRPAGFFDGMVYVGAEDADLYALESSSGRVRWRHVAGTPITRRPEPTETDLYIVSAKSGMTRLDRATGEPVWRIPTPSGLSESNASADRFLAANPKYVYVADASGRLLILDRRRGVTLSGFDTHDFVYPIPNTTTDRLYLAANNGLIVCLHDREYARPIRHRLREEEALNPIRLHLADRITDPGTKEMALRDMLDLWTKRFPPLRFRIDDAAFQAAGRESPAGDNVKMPNPIKDRQLGDVFTEMMVSIKCIFEVVGDTIVIFPAPAAP